MYFSHIKTRACLRKGESFTRQSQLSKTRSLNPGSSGCTAQDLITGSSWFDPWIVDSNCDKIHGLLIVIVTRFISLSLTADHCFDGDYVGKQPLAWKEYRVQHW